MAQDVSTTALNPWYTVLQDIDLRTGNLAAEGLRAQDANLPALRAALQREAAYQGISYDEMLKRLKALWKDVAFEQQRPLLNRVIALDYFDPNMKIESMYVTPSPQVQQMALQAALQYTPASVLAAAPVMDAQSIAQRAALVSKLGVTPQKISPEMAQTLAQALAQQAAQQAAQQTGTTTVTPPGLQVDPGAQPPNPTVDATKDSRNEQIGAPVTVVSASQPKIRTWGWVAIGAAGLFVVSKLFGRRER